MIAQESWAFAVSDTLIIDGEVIYIEERNTPVTDSLNNSRKMDFKEKRKPLIWGVDGGFGIQITDFDVANNLNKELLSVNEFLGVEKNTYYHSNVLFGGYIQVHRNIQIGTSVNLSSGKVNLSTADLIAPSDVVSFYTNDNQIQQVFVTEVEPEVFELDTAVVKTFSEKYNLLSFQIPLKFRFYVNEFSTKSKWRAFGEISPIYRSFRLKSNSGNSEKILFLNSSGNNEYINDVDFSWHSFGVLVGAGSEFKFSKKIDLFIQGNWSFPPVNNIGNTGLTYFTQYSNLYVGIRILMSERK